MTISMTADEKIDEYLQTKFLDEEIEKIISEDIDRRYRKEKQTERIRYERPL
jgi:hypothetical protein